MRILLSELDFFFLFDFNRYSPSGCLLNKAVGNGLMLIMLVWNQPSLPKTVINQMTKGQACYARAVCGGLQQERWAGLGVSSGKYRPDSAHMKLTCLKHLFIPKWQAYIYLIHFSLLHCSSRIPLMKTCLIKKKLSVD